MRDATQQRLATQPEFRRFIRVRHYDLLPGYGWPTYKLRFEGAILGRNGDTYGEILGRVAAISMEGDIIELEEKDRVEGDQVHIAFVVHRKGTEPPTFERMDI